MDLNTKYVSVKTHHESCATDTHTHAQWTSHALALPAWHGARSGCQRSQEYGSQGMYMDEEID